MSKRDPIFTPELVKVLKIFIFSSLALVLVLSFFNGYRANNSGEDRTFRVTDSNRLYFQNVRSIHYDREIRQDASMTLFRHRNRLETDTLPSLDLVIILNPVKDDAYIYFELKNGEWPIQIRTTYSGMVETIDFGNGNNLDHFDLLRKITPAIEQNAQFELILGGKIYPLWAEEKEKDVFKTVSEDYFRLLDITN